MKKITILLTITICLLSFSFSALAKRERVVLCTDRSYWYPFVFINSYKPDGLYVDIVKDAADRLDWRVSIRPMDWKKCLRAVETGSVDGILGASYKAKRAEFLFYPLNADNNKIAPTRLSSADYVVVNTVGSSYSYNGDVTTLPQPVRVPRGYSVADDLRKGGIEVDDKSSRGDEVTLMKMVSSGKGSVVTLRSVAKKYMASPAFRGKLKVQAKTYKSKDYFLAISKASDMTLDKREALWGAIGAVNDDVDLIAEYQSKY